MKELLTLKHERNTALDRARWCKANGFECYAADVRIARSIHRTLLRHLRATP